MQTPPPPEEADYSSAHITSASKKHHKPHGALATPITIASSPQEPPCSANAANNDAPVPFICTMHNRDLMIFVHYENEGMWGGQSQGATFDLCVGANLTGWY